MDSLLDAFNHFLNLEIQHPNDTAEFIEYLHNIQRLIAVRIARRAYPTGWPTYKGIK